MYIPNGPDAMLSGENGHDKNSAGHSQHAIEHAGSERHREQPQFKADLH
jgi:hypothetical protein